MFQYILRELKQSTPNSAKLFTSNKFSQACVKQGYPEEKLQQNAVQNEANMSHSTNK